MYFAFLLFDLGDASVFLPIAAIMSAFGLILLVWRVSIINAVFAAGHEAEATITGTSFFRGRGRIEYTYLFQGSHYNSGNAVQETKATNAVQVGNKVIVLVDPNRPKRAFIRDLYQ
jgi:hypothetical protein